MTTSDENDVAGLIDYDWCGDSSSIGVTTPQTPQVGYLFYYLKQCMLPKL